LPPEDPSQYQTPRHPFRCFAALGGANRPLKVQWACFVRFRGSDTPQSPPAHPNPASKQGATSAESAVASAAGGGHRVWQTLRGIFIEFRASAELWHLYSPGTEQRQAASPYEDLTTRDPIKTQESHEVTRSNRKHDPLRPARVRFGGHVTRDFCSQMYTLDVMECFARNQGKKKDRRRSCDLIKI